MDHCYLNTPWYECPENSDPGNTEYLYTPIFLRHAKEIMGEEGDGSLSPRRRRQRTVPCLPSPVSPVFVRKLS